ncbi:hypothetical protein VTK56DRAFT_7413 [Thermocarpiscus australiensis]
MKGRQGLLLDSNGGACQVFTRGQRLKSRPFDWRVPRSDAALKHGPLAICSSVYLLGYHLLQGKFKTCKHTMCVSNTLSRRGLQPKSGDVPSHPAAPARCNLSKTSISVRASSSACPALGLCIN